MESYANTAPPAPQQHLLPIAEEGESAAEEGASVEGASSQGRGRVAALDSESDLDMTEVGLSYPQRVKRQWQKRKSEPRE